MSRILLIEDRSLRQKKFFNETKIDIESYSDILDNAIDEKYQKILDELQKDTCNFDEYSIIISHKSAFGDENTRLISKLEKYCHNNHKTLVLFSGGIDTNYYLKDDEFELLEVNSKIFYSQNLKTFLEDFRNGNFQPLILSYGNRWKLNILLNILEKLNKYLGEMKKEKVLYKAFLRDNPDIQTIETLNINLYEPLVQERKISIVEIEKFKNSVLKYINESLLHE